MCLNNQASMSTMSMPRRAMKDMGLQACCLWCDEPDEAGSSRCTKCIASHKRVRDEIAKAPPEDAFYQFAKELLAMAVAPHRHDNDPVLVKYWKNSKGLLESTFRKVLNKPKGMFWKYFNIRKILRNQTSFKTSRTRTHGKRNHQNRSSHEGLVQIPGVRSQSIQISIMQEEQFQAKILYQ